MARIQFGQSKAQVEGRLVPVAEMSLAAGDGVYFTHNMYLWQEPSVHVDAMPLSKPWTRHRAGMPLVMLTAEGPGRIAFSHNEPGELIALPLQRGAAVDVREHTLLVATKGVAYDWHADQRLVHDIGRPTAAAGVGRRQLAQDGPADGRCARDGP